MMAIDVSPRQQRRVDAVRPALAQQADTVQHMFNLANFLLNERLPSCTRETLLCLRQPLQQLSEDTLGVADAWKCILTTDGFQSSPPDGS